MSRLELKIPSGTSQEERQKAFKILTALHNLSIGNDREGIRLFLTSNLLKMQAMAAECEDDITLRWLQGAIQIISSLIEHIDDAGEELHNFRKADVTGRS